MEFFKNTDWLTLPDGHKYQGDVDGQTGLPHGLGILVLIEGNYREEQCYYIGEFRQGKRDGHGYLLCCRYVSEPYWQRGTYEEVMATAEFDQCGRVIHCEPVGKWVDSMAWRWQVEQNGLWAADALVSQDPYNFTKLEPWVKGKLRMTVQQLTDGEWKDVEYDWHNSENFQYSLSENFGYWKNKWPGYDNRVAVNRLTRDRLIICNEYAHVFTLGYGEQHSWVRRDKPDERFVYCIEDK
jgi:hypothetical protein